MSILSDANDRSGYLSTTATCSNRSLNIDKRHGVFCRAFTVKPDTFWKKEDLGVNAVCAGQRILKKVDFRCCKGEYDEQNGNQAEQGDRRLGIFTSGRATVKPTRFVDISNRSGDEENRDIDPVGRASDDAVIGVKENRDQRKTEQDASQLDTPKILAVTEEKALHNSEDKHWPKEQLHVFPG